MTRYCDNLTYLLLVTSAWANSLCSSLDTLYTSTYPMFCFCLALSNFTPFLSSLPPSRPLLLPASCCSGPLGSYRSPADKRMDRTTPENNLATDLDLFVLCPTLSPTLPCYRQTLFLSALPLRECSRSLVSASSNGHSDKTCLLNLIHNGSLPSTGPDAMPAGASPSVPALTTEEQK